MSSKSARHRAREFALQGIYQWQVSGNEVTSIGAHGMQVNGFDKADAELYRMLLRGTLNDVEELQATVQQFIDRPWNEMSPIERGVLLLGAYEFKHQVGTPYRVVLNEAIELAKEYGGTDGHKFVNGVLDKLALELRPNEAKPR